MAALFVTDPFKGNINPGEAEGVKLFCQTTADIPPEQKFFITHPPDKHDKWAERRNAYRNRRKNKSTTQSTTNTESNSTGSTSDKLVLKDSMKKALLSHFEITEEQANEIMNQANENSEFQ